MNSRTLIIGALIATLAPFAWLATGEDRVENSEPLSTRPHRTLFVTRSLAHDALLPYLATARPEIVQIGNYGAMFHGYADNPRSMKTPMMLPVSGERAALQFQKQLNGKVHDLGLKVVGHFRLVKVMADWKEQSGFVDYYNNRWPEDLLGPKPHPNLIELLQRDAAGNPIQLSRYDNAQLALCLSSPHARQMLKQMLKCAVDQGIDGVITTYNYRQSCACSYCQIGFRKWLAERLPPERVRGVLKNNSIPVQIPGYPGEDATELDWLAMRWGAEHFKAMFDDVFLKYGRSLREDLLVAQWNHLSHVSIKEERMFLPGPLWGRGEDYFWYSGGASFVGKNLNLSEQKAGDAWLSCLYVRERSGGRPFVMGKYDRIRLAASMAEGYAMGGLGMGRYMRFENATGFEVLTRYTNFMHRHRHLYDRVRPYADAALVLPGQSVWNGDPESLDEFRSLGQALVERQVLIDVVADEAMSRQRLSRYRAVILPRVNSLSNSQLKAMLDYAASGGLVLVRGELATHDETGRPRPKGARPDVVTVGGDTSAAADEIVTRLANLGASRIEAPWTLRATAYAQPNRLILHLVNYDRDETPDRQRKGPELERPKPVLKTPVRIRVPDGRQAESVTLFGPDRKAPVWIAFQQNKAHVSFRVPEFLVYAVVSLELAPRVEAVKEQR